MKTIKSYYKKVEQLLPLNKIEKSKYMDIFKSNVDDYLYDHPDSDMDTIMEHFGTPESIASCFLSGEDDSYISQKINAAKFMKKGMLTFLLSISIIVILSLTYVIHDTYQKNHGNIEMGNEIDDGTEIETEASTEESAIEYDMAEEAESEVLSDDESEVFFEEWDE